MKMSIQKINQRAGESRRFIQVVMGQLLDAGNTTTLAYYLKFTVAGLNRRLDRICLHSHSAGTTISIIGGRATMKSILLFNRATTLSESK
jgi:hypothetical protein